jgi:hypothetical protein
MRNGKDYTAGAEGVDERGGNCQYRACPEHLTTCRLALYPEIHPASADPRYKADDDVANDIVEFEKGKGRRAEGHPLWPAGHLPLKGEIGWGEVRRYYSSGRSATQNRFALPAEMR